MACSAYTFILSCVDVLENIKFDLGLQYTTLVRGGPSVVSDGPSLIESCDFCVSMKLSSTI